MEPSHRYRSVEEAEGFLATTVSRHLREAPLADELHPLVIGVTGGGNVAKGALEMIDRLPVVEIDPDDLPGLAQDDNRSHRAIYKVVFRRQHRLDFARHLPYLTVLVNGIYWEPGHPKLVTKGDLRRLWESETAPRLRVVADLSCDVDGSFEATVRTTTPDAPVFVYDPLTGEDADGVEGRGPVVLAVDNLPAEFPRDASEHFGDSLFPFLPGLAGADFTKDYEHLTLPAAVAQAVITHQGELTPRYRHLEAALREATSGAPVP